MGQLLQRMMDALYTKKLEVVLVGLENRCEQTETAHFGQDINDGWALFPRRLLLAWRHGPTAPSNCPSRQLHPFLYQWQDNFAERAGEWVPGGNLSNNWAERKTC